MPNERLRRALLDADLTIDDLATAVEIDPKTAERWITLGRVPHARNRARAARLLSCDEIELWPELAEHARSHAATEAEVLHIYPHRGAVPAALWYELLEGARERVDILVYAGLFLPDGRADLVTILRRKAEEGVQVRLLYGDPRSAAVECRGAEEGIGGGMAARIELALTYLRPAFSADGVEARLHETTLYNSIFRYDDDMLVNTHAYGVGAPNAPVFHIRRMPGGALFEHYAASVERVWNQATLIPDLDPARTA